MLLGKNSYKKVVIEQKKLYPKLDTLSIIETVQYGINDKEMISRIRQVREQEELKSDKDIEDIEDMEDVEDVDNQQEEEITNSELVGLYALDNTLKQKREDMIEDGLDTSEVDEKILKVEEEIEELESQEVEDDTITEQKVKKQKKQKVANKPVSKSNKKGKK